MKNKLYFALLGVSLLAPAAVRALRFGGVSGLVICLWLYLYLELACRFRTRRERLLTGLGFVAGYCLYFWNVLGNPLLSLLLSLVLGGLMYPALLTVSALMLRYDRFPVTLVLPVMWLLGYLLATLVRVPSAMRLDLAFNDMTALLLTERVIGSAGLSFLLLWAVAVLRFAVAGRRLRYAALCGIIALALVLPGLSVTDSVSEPECTVRVAYATGPYMGDFLNYYRVPYEEHERSVENAVRSAASGQADVLVFSEEAFEMDDTDEARFLSHCAGLARQYAVSLLLGLDIADTDGSEGGLSINKLVMYNSRGELQGTYQKSRLIPVMEADYASGDGRIPSYCLDMPDKHVKVSYLICYDSNFPGYVKRMDADTDILFLPSWDWASVTELHGEICRSLAVQNNVSVLKVTYDGLSLAIRPDGTVYHSSSTDSDGYEAVHFVDMPVY